MCHDNVRLETQDIFAMLAQSWQQIELIGVDGRRYQSHSKISQDFQLFCFLQMAICKKRLTSDHEVVKGEMPVVCKKWLTGIIPDLRMRMAASQRERQSPCGWWLTPVPWDW